MINRIGPKVCQEVGLTAGQKFANSYWIASIGIGTLLGANFAKDICPREPAIVRSVPMICLTLAGGVVGPFLIPAYALKKLCDLHDRK